MGGEEDGGGGEVGVGEEGGGVRVQESSNRRNNFDQAFPVFTDLRILHNKRISNLQFYHRTLFTFTF
jgi:hypothetical protein